MYDREQEERKPITQSGAVKSVPVVVEIFEVQLRFRRINLRTQLAQFIAQRVRGPAEFESVALMVSRAQGLQLRLRCGELRLIIVAPEIRRDQPRVRRFLRRRDEEEYAPIHHMPEE